MTNFKELDYQNFILESNTNYNDSLKVSGKVARRILKILATQTSVCGNIKAKKRQKNSNCFLTANYIGYGVTSMGDLGKHYIPSMLEGKECFENVDDAREKFGFPLYGVAINKRNEELHAFIILGELEGCYFCFHQRGDGGEYEILPLEAVYIDWVPTLRDEGEIYYTRATKYSFTGISK